LVVDTASFGARHWYRFWILACKLLLHF
jgi:hypothetical protein